MTEYSHTMLIQDDVLIVPVQGDLIDAEAKSFQNCILEKVKKTNVDLVLIDISSLETLDLFLARLIEATVKMVSLLDARTVVSGMRPEIAITLSEMGITFDSIKMAPNLDAGLRILRNKKKQVSR